MKTSVWEHTYHGPKENMAAALSGAMQAACLSQWMRPIRLLKFRETADGFTARVLMQRLDATYDDVQRVVNQAMEREAA